MYPITLKIEGKPCVVVGGGNVALSRIGALLKAKAAVTVVSPDVSPAIEQLVLDGRMKVVRKQVELADYQDAFLIIAATDDPEINRGIYESVKDTKLVNVASDAQLGNFHIPATLTRGRLQISISTGGASPMLARRIHDDLEERYDESYESYLEFLYEARLKIKRHVRSIEDRKQLYKEALDEKYRHSVQERSEFLERMGCEQ